MHRNSLEGLGLGDPNERNHTESLGRRICWELSARRHRIASMTGDEVVGEDDDVANPGIEKTGYRDTCLETEDDNYSWLPLKTQAISRGLYRFSFFSFGSR